MRLYKFLNEKRGLQAIQERRLRISRLKELNDEFEFIGLALEKRKDRLEMLQMREHLHERNGIICMSKRFSSPLLWGHYADSLKGLALGFDVDRTAFEKIKYCDARPTLSDFSCSTFDEITSEHIKRLVCMKFSAWNYEEEYRTFQRLRNPDENGNYFLSFSPKMRLASVVVGPRSTLTRSDISAAVSDLVGVEAFKARAGFKRFEVVKNKKIRMWK